MVSVLSDSGVCMCVERMIVVMTLDDDKQFFQFQWPVA